jgi:DNA polymerase-1
MLIRTEKQWQTLLNRIRNGPAVTVYDLETTGLEPFKQDRLIGVAVLIPDVTEGTDGKSFYAPFRHAVGKNLPFPNRNIRRLGPLFSDPARVLVGFNLKFDVHFTEVERVKVRNQMVDVMLAAHLANENEMNFGLKHLGAKYVNPDAAKTEKELLQKLKDRKLKKEDMKHLPPEEVAPYAEQDVRLTWQLNKFYNKNLKAQGLNHMLPSINKYMVATTAMERRGVLVDPEGCRRNLVLARKTRARLYKEMVAIVGRDFNPNSVPQLRKILRQKATDRKALKKSKHPVARLLVQDRSWGKAEGTFYHGFLDSMDSGYRIHPNIVLHGTISGRPSCRKPNLQALPKKSGKIYRVRDLIVAPPGYTLMSWDWNQAELRLLAHYTRDPFLLDAFRQKKDIHQEIADMLNIPRESGKRINFGSVYGVGADTLSMELDIPRARAKEYLNRYHRLIPGIRKLYYVAQHIAGRDRKIPMWTGRLRHYRQEDATRKAMSNLIQGGVAEMMRAAITRLHNLIDSTDAYQILQIHDEILFEIPVGQEADWAVAIKRIMEDFEFSVPIVAEGRMGYSWSADDMRSIDFNKSDNPLIPKLGRRGT